MSPLDPAIEKFGLSALAKKLGCKPQTIQNWRARGVPVDQAAGFETACEGIVTRKDMRPDDWQKIWPELAERQGSASPVVALA